MLSQRTRSEGTIFKRSSSIMAVKSGRKSWKGRIKVRSCCITHTKRVFTNSKAAFPCIKQKSFWKPEAW